ncbi:uncharacterized protein LOC143441293 isoform X1 [Arvicanthis niloticus]|uniref:uncharacterized protein LOC143311511 isoform X1 n=1 Tax=Arvicanthis niloticus TaxID=61156 RepID=UPI00402BDA71
MESSKRLRHLRCGFQFTDPCPTVNLQLGAVTVLCFCISGRPQIPGLDSPQPSSLQSHAPTFLGSPQSFLMMPFLPLWLNVAAAWGLGMVHKDAWPDVGSG